MYQLHMLLQRILQVSSAQTFYVIAGISGPPTLHFHRCTST